MARRSFVQIGGKLYERGVDRLPDDGGVVHRSHTVMGDLCDFISPIDGSLVSGRAGMREHCKRHDVVPTAELAGLPTRRPQQVDEQYRQQTRQVIADVMNSRNYKG